MTTVYDAYEEEGEEYLRDLAINIAFVDTEQDEASFKTFMHTIHKHLVKPGAYVRYNRIITIDHTPEGIRVTIGKYTIYSTP